MDLQLASWSQQQCSSHGQIQGAEHPHDERQRKCFKLFFHFEVNRLEARRDKPGSCTVALKLKLIFTLRLCSPLETMVRRIGARSTAVRTAKLALLTIALRGTRSPLENLQ